MPHERYRYLLPILEKRLRFFPVVGILGARQTGKSTLIRDILARKRKIEYITLDREENRARAMSSPTLFIKNINDIRNGTVCIDEIQKAPVLFDTIKAEVDEAKRPGRFLVTGSTEFSKRTGVRESLTGRIALLRLFPLSVGEIRGSAPQFPMTLLRKITLNKGDRLRDVHHWRQLGGMPGICFIRDNESRTSLFNSWLETTCSRDLANFEIPKFNPDLARRILVAIAQCDVPIKTEIARYVGKLPRQIELYLEALKSLHVIYEIDPLATGTGKSHFYLFDSGLAQVCGSSEKRRLQIWFLNECYSQFSGAGIPKPDILFYQTAKGSRVDFVIRHQEGGFAFMLTEEETPSPYYMRTAEAFSHKHPRVSVLVLTPGLRPYKVSQSIHIHSWSAIV